MSADLLDEVVKGSLDGRGWAGSFLLGGQLAGGQAQIQGDERSLARRILIDDGFQMDQFGPEDLKALLDFLDLVADFFFVVGSFVDLVTDVNVHCSSLERGNKSPVKLRSLQKNCTPGGKERKRRLRRLCLSCFTYLFHVDGILR